MIGTWVDGSCLYRKTYIANDIPITSKVEKSYDIEPNLPVNWYIKSIHGICQFASSSDSRYQIVENGNNFGDNSVHFFAYKTGDGLLRARIYNGYSAVSANVELTITYIKK